MKRKPFATKAISPAVVATFAMISMAAGELGAQALVFDPPVTYPAFNHPWGLAIDDFNGDMIPDAATSDTGDWISGNNGSLVSIYLGNGDGTFQTRADYPAGNMPVGLVTGDFNEDGAPDVATANRRASGGNSTVSILLNKNDGSGTFHPQHQVPSGRQPIHVEVGRLNGDSHLDIAVAVHGHNAVQILLGAGDGTFTDPNPWIPVGSGIDGIKIGDVNNDGKLDVVTSNWWAYNVSVLLGNGDGTFTEKLPRSPIGRRTWNLGLGDFNEDGKLDAVAPSALDKTLSFLAGKGDGTFQPQLVTTLGFDPYEVTVVDIDQDGHLDWVGAAGGVRIMRGAGDGTFQMQHIASAAQPMADVADLNGDGALDIVTTDNTQQTISVFLQVPPNQDPVADAGENQTVECEGLLTTVTLDGSASYDPDGDDLEYEWSVATGSGASIDDPTSPTPTAQFPLGPTMVTLTVTDGNGGLDTADVVITVEDTTPPALVCTTNVATLWPPNHKMWDVDIYVAVTEACSNLDDLVLTAEVSSSEPDDATGDGATNGDVDGEDGYTAPVPVDLLFDADSGLFTGAVQLRAQRDGAEAGRVYSIVCEVTDLCGNNNTASCVVIVPHDKRKKK